jgi:hypothetical protein
MNQLTGSIEKQTNDRETDGMKNRKPERPLSECCSTAKYLLQAAT